MSSEETTPKATVEDAIPVTAAVTILPPVKVTADALGLGDIFELVKKLRELARKFEGQLTFDLAGDGLLLVLTMLGMPKEAEEANLFVDQLAFVRPAIRDENGSEIRLRRMLVDRFLPAATGGDFSLLALPEGGPADNREPTWNPLPLHAGFARLAAGLEGHVTTGFSATSDAPPKEYDPKFLPPIVWQIGGSILFELIKRLIERRMGKSDEG